MNKNLSICFKSKNVLVDELLKKENIRTYKKQNILDKLTFKTKTYPDIYFHSGVLDEESIELVENSKKTIANSYTMKQDMIKACNITNEKIEVIYPTITSTYLKPKESKEILTHELNLNKKDKIILFHAKNLIKNGVMEFLNIIATLSSNNFKAIIAGDAKQIYTLKFKFTKYNLDNKVILLEDYQNVDLLYSAADIYILPTYIKSFSSNVIKAMFYKTAVFVSANSASREVIDIFSTMDSPTDRSMQFKVEAILSNKDELKNIKKTNKETADEFLFDIQFKRLEEILSDI
ncbi:MAG: glycosyltransferase [Arcobacter sp.]|uniref:glycosyltransferase n=1 Tax=Arcobacter sp. TaxID=1872629 RepID=UPI003AFFD7A0